MTKEERYIARIIFKNKIYAADKQAFEDLFTKVKQNEDNNFKQVKPQGRFGDGKCDGFNSITGEYYQVYAPEELSGNETTLLSKMNSSIDGLINFWEERNFNVNKFCYVVKDDYRAVYALLYTNLKKVSEKYGIECRILICRDLEDTFMKLDEDKMIDVLGSIIPDPYNIENVEFNIMQEVIEFLSKMKGSILKEAIPANPDFEKKIVFNKLTKAVGAFLNFGQLQSFAIRDFFELNSNFAKEELRIVFNNIYSQGIKEIPESDTKNDEVFQYIVEKSSPKDNFAFYSAVYVLMAYYFEYCDIFETPN